MIHRKLARQLGNPDGHFGKILAPLWNQRNSVRIRTHHEAL